MAAAAAPAIIEAVHDERLGRYELVCHLATGGMARVYLARVSGLAGFSGHVVLKTVRPEQVADPAAVSMFLDEARLAASLNHHHIAQVHEFGVADDGTYFLAMEYVHGETVRAVLDRARARGHRLRFDFAVTVVAAACAGLHHAHERRGPHGPLDIVHRDVSPSNLIAGHDGSVKLIDFGIAHATERTTETAVGMTKGKPGYMAPEQALGKPVDRRSDIFALGVVLYELTTQVRAFRASSEHETVRRIVRGEVVPPSQRVPAYPAELEQIVLTAMQTDPARRYQDADEMRRDLELAADRLGLQLGERAVTRTLGELFGVRDEPWMDAVVVEEIPWPAEDEMPTGRLIILEAEPELRIADPIALPALPRKLARGTVPATSRPAREPLRVDPVALVAALAVVAFLLLVLIARC